jgi:hypothetical protein
LKDDTIFDDPWGNYLFGIGHMKVYIFGKPDPHTFLT